MLANNINVFSLRTGPPQCPLSFQVYLRWKENMIQTFTSACCRLMLRSRRIGKSGVARNVKNATRKSTFSIIFTSIITPFGGSVAIGKLCVAFNNFKVVKIALYDLLYGHNVRKYCFQPSLLKKNSLLYCLLYLFTGLIFCGVK